jgi:hypothetical protein
MNDKIPKTLTEIFARTDTVRHGPFALIKQPGQLYRNAMFLVDGHLVSIPAAQKKLMALLISQKGGDMTMPLLAEGMETPKFAAIAREMQDPATKDQAINDANSAFRAHISLIKKAIRTTLERYGTDEERLELILGSIQPLRKGGPVPQGITPFDSGYRIDLLL